MASACIKAAICYIWMDGSLALVLVIVVLVELMIRLVLYYIFRQTRFCCRGEPVPSSCYESINYAWRSVFLSFDFQSPNIFTQIIFYVENILCFVAWALCARTYATSWIREMIYIPNLIAFCSFTGMSITWLLVCNFFGLIKLYGACS